MDGKMTFLAKITTLLQHVGTFDNSAVFGSRISIVCVFYVSDNHHFCQRLVLPSCHPTFVVPLCCLNIVMNSIALTFRNSTRSMKPSLFLSNILKASFRS